MQIKATELDSLANLIEELCGIYLDDSKTYLLESRLEPLATKHNCADYSQLVGLALRADHAGLRSDIVDAITTNETLFFRDRSPFEALQFKIVPEILDRIESGKKSGPIRIWSAACSTGQEAYSLAMTMQGIVAGNPNWKFEILGTDVSPAALSRAKKGNYTDLELSRGIDQQTQAKYFHKDGDGWQIAAALRDQVQFQSRNLLEPFPEKGRFDIVFCRNVGIYFRKEERDDLFRRIAKTLDPNGFLFVGSSESLVSLGPEFLPQTHCNCTVYQPNADSQTPARAV